MGTRQQGMRLEGTDGGKRVLVTPPNNDAYWPALQDFGFAMVTVGNSFFMGRDQEESVRKARTAAKELIDSHQSLIREEAPELWHDCGSIESLKSCARGAFNMTIAHNIYMTDHEVLETAFNTASERENPTMAAALLMPPIQMRVGWGARWYEQTMPRIVWADPKFPEMLMASKADASVEDLVRPPWGAFLIDLPRKLLFSSSPVVPGRTDELVHVLVHYQDVGNGPVWNFLVEGDGGCELWRHGLSTKQLLRLDDTTFNKDFTDTLTASDERILVLIGRLIVGTCLTLSDPESIREAKRTKKTKKNAKRQGSSKTPMTRNFVVGKPIKLQCRETLQEWVKKGNRKGVSPNVQTLVRGHWKMQPHGPQHSLRKLVHLEPYWRGVGKGKATVTRSTEL